MIKREWSNQLNLIEKNKIRLLVSHKENKKILEKYLQERFNVLKTSLIKNKSVSDIIIIDEQGLKDNKDTIVNIKNSNISLYLPVILITRTPINNISRKYLEIIDEIVNIPVSKEILNARIENLLNIRKLFLSTQIYQKLTESNPVGICIIRDNRIIKYVNQSFLNIIKKSKSNVLGKDIYQIFDHNKFKEFINKEEGGGNGQLIIKLVKLDPPRWVDVRFSKMKYENIDLKLLIFVDVSKQKEYEEKIKYLRFHDQLTGLYNRDFYIEELKRLNTERQHPISLIMGDINNLKLINDAFGHNKGDMLIKEIAKIMQNNIREEDVLARLSGDEFAILLPQTKKEKAKDIIQRIEESCAKIDIATIPVSVALGIATKESPKQSISEVFKKADSDMYQNKTAQSSKVIEKTKIFMENHLSNKTNESKEHRNNMEKIAAILADELNLDNQQKDKLILLAQIHDIGKLSIPEEILKKPESLTEKEFQKVKSHTESGYRIAQYFGEFSHVAEEILHHHEQWNGEGYPGDLKEEDIPFLARILSIIDAYEVMTHDRSYKRAKSKKVALEEISTCAGSQFDPILAERIIEALKNTNI